MEEFAVEAPLLSEEWICPRCGASHGHTLYTAGCKIIRFRRTNSLEDDSQALYGVRVPIEPWMKTTPVWGTREYKDYSASLLPKRFGMFAQDEDST